MAQLFHQYGWLRVLAAQAQHGGASNIGMMNVTGEQSAKGLGILTCAAAAPFVHQESHPVHIGKTLLGRAGSKIVFPRGFLLKLVDQLPYLLAVKLWAAIAELFFEGIAQGFHIAVLAKNKRDDQPVIACSYLTVGTMVAIESARSPARD